MRSSLTSDSWSLFLDRDGVINTRLVNDYVKQPSDFKFTKGFTQALSKVSPLFRNIVVVTNQQGIGKGLMTDEELHEIHHLMLEEIENHGGRIHKVYYCPDLKGSGSRNRKPQVGMALQARRDFPSIRFNRSVMVGDSQTDLEFGRKLKMVTVFIDNGDHNQLPPFLADYRFNSFADFSNWITQ